MRYHAVPSNANLTEESHRKKESEPKVDSDEEDERMAQAAGHCLRQSHVT